MRTKKVSRYWCDFCNKAGLQSNAMAKHEKHCTMNPARTCRVCKLIEDGMDSDEFEAKKPLAELVAMLPDFAAYAEAEKQLQGANWEKRDQAEMAFRQEVAGAMPALRKAAGNCPACIMAALRQAKIYINMADGFDYKAEMQVILDEYRAHQYEEMQY